MNDETVWEMFKRTMQQFSNNMLYQKELSSHVERIISAPVMPLYPAYVPIQLNGQAGKGPMRSPLFWQKGFIVFFL